ncbi:UbiX family flavin prenyltransferase [Lacrimispora indolis]|uniref:UbiX family flavin prenyltransferase n=1 Tax=Lacrimispora indolis TaxID=69825 RepID=UPI000429AC8F|nr:MULTISPECIES: UbiX family flavin prenyltransferase [Lachnospiraceae]MBE7722022.1 UbiX family flavin prenyltransferase [Lacrimispora celerecrescens]
MKQYVVGITGASGSIYGLRTIEALLEAGARVRLILTETGEKVIAYETGREPGEWIAEFKARFSDLLILEDNKDLFSAAASGSHLADGMVIAPCSMSKLAHIAAGITPDLLTRAADVALKQRRPLVVMPRETPLSQIHLKNMLTLAECGAFIVPAMPAFYQKPKCLDDMADFMAGRVLDCLGVENHRYARWKEKC